MSRDFPDWINPWTAGEGRREYQGTVPLARMERLRGLLAETSGEAEFSASFALDEDQRPLIVLHVSARLPLICQASLEPYAERVERVARLAVVESEADMARVPDDYESTRASHGRLAFLDLVEDELLLGMPQFPRRRELDAVDYSSGGVTGPGGEKAETRKPFAGLDELMRKRSG